MKRLSWIMLFLFGLFKRNSCQDCSSITIEPLEPGWTNKSTFTIGVTDITFNITYNCSTQTHINITWSSNSTQLDKNSNIKSIEPASSSTGNSLSFTNRTGLSAIEVTLSYISVNSRLVVKEGATEAAAFLINVGNCTDGEGTYSYLDVINETCLVTEICLNTGDVNGNRTKTCGKFTEWNMTKCTKEEYEFNFTSPTLTVPAGENVVFKCDLPFMTLLDGKEVNVTTINDDDKAISVEDNGKVISCFKRDEQGNKTRVKTATVIVSTRPVQKETSSYSVMIGQRSQLEFQFWANGIVSREQIKISHKDKEIADFYFRRTEGILHEILLTFPETKNEDIGDYIIYVNGTTDYCSGNFTVTLSPSFTLHYGWITSIVLGSVLLIAIIVFIVVICRQKKSHDEDIALTSLSTPSAPVQHTTSPQRPRNEVSAATSNHHRTQQFRNDNYQHASDDDEFDNSFDEYEDMAGDDRHMRERPPMPLPPTPRNDRRSPVPPRNGYDSRPPAPSPHRGHAHTTNTLGFSPPPMRNVPMPPPHGMRQQQMPGYPSRGQGFDLGYR